MLPFLWNLSLYVFLSPHCILHGDLLVYFVPFLIGYFSSDSLIHQVDPVIFHKSLHHKKSLLLSKQIVKKKKTFLYIEFFVWEVCKYLTIGYTESSKVLYSYVFNHQPLGCGVAACGLWFKSQKKKKKKWYLIFFNNYDEDSVRTFWISQVSFFSLFAFYLSLLIAGNVS